MKRVLIFIMLISMILTNGVFTQSIVIEAEDQQTSLLLVQEDITLTEDKEVDELLIKQGTLDLNGHTLKVKGEAIHEGGTLSVHGGSLQVAGDYRLQSKISENTYTSGEGTILMADNADSIIVHGDFITESSISSDGNITKGILEVKGNITQLDTVISDNLVMTGISLLKLSGTVKQHINLCSAGAANSKFANLLIENEQGIELDSDIYVSGNINDNNYPVTGKTVYVSKEATFSNHSFNGSVHLKGLSEETDFLQKVGGNLIVEESSINLSADLVVGGSLTIKNGELFLKGYTVTVEKDTIFDNSTIKLDHGKYYTKENMTLQGNSCSMIMFFSDDYVFVGGNYVIESLTPEYTLIGYSKQNTFYAGKLEIKGNMIEQCKSEAAAFITGANHTTIFSGEKYQKVIEETGRIQFGKVIVTNTSDEGIYVPKGFRYTTSLTLNEIKYTTDAVEKRGWTLKRDEEYNGDFCLSEGTLKLNGHSLKINGNLIQSGGTLIVDGGDLEVGGDYRIQTQKGTGATVEYDRSNGELYMTSDEDYVLVGGSFITASNYTGKLLAGIMEIKGNIQVLSPYRFEPKENHTMILSGETSQSIDLGDDLSASIFNIELKNTSKAGVIFEHTPTLSGNINFNQTPVSVSAICITDTTSFTDDEYEGNIITKGTMSLDMLSHIRGNLTVTGKVTLGKTLIVDGGLAIKNGSLSLGTNECRVLGDVVSDGGTLDISDGSMYCKKRLQAKRIEMKDSGFLLVEGDFFVSTSECRGTVELKGNFTEQGEDKVYISTVKLSGEKLQTINFISDNSYFDKVEFYNTSREGVYSETGIHCPNINTNNTVYRTGCNGRKGWILTEDEVYTGDFYLQSDILDLNGHTLTVNGNLYQLNGKIKFNGGTLIVNGDFRQETFFEMNGTTVQKAGWGNIYMNTSESNLFIRGDFIVGTHGGTAVDNGTLELKGSLLAEQANNSSSFVLCEGANIIFSGEMVQLISCRELKDKYSTNIRLSGNTYFKNSMDNGIKIVGYGVVAEGRIISNDKHIDGWLQMKETASFEKKYFCGNVMSTYSLPSDILNNEFIIKGDLYVNDDLCFKEKLVVEGNITCEQCNSTFTKSLEVYGDFITKNYGGFVVQSGEAKILGNLDVGDNSRVRFSDSLLTVNGNILVHDSNNFYIDNSNLFCKGNFELSQSDGLTYSNSWITFYGTNYFYVGGNIDVYDKVYFDLSNTNTTIELKGDFNEIEYDSQYKSLSAYGNKDIKLILSGDHIQKIGYSTNNKDGIHLVLKNTSVSGVQFLTKTIPAGTIESNGCKVRCLGGGIYGWTLEEDMVMEGDLNLAQGELNLNGHTLKINGNFYAGRGNVDLNGGKLLVSGDLRMQSYDGKDTDYSEASVQMTEKEEYICVGGDFVIQSNSKTSSFSSGTLEVKGNFIRHPNCSDFYTPSASHMLVFSGENDQHIQCMFKSGRPFDFNHITIKPSKKESFVYFHSYTKIAGTISDLGKRSRMYSDNSANILLSVNNLEDIEQGYLGADVICSQNQEILNYDLNMDGLLALCKPFDLNGHKVNAGSFSMSAETLAINGGKIITKKECSLTDTKLIMNQKEDTISVSGDFSFHNGKSELTAGIIDIKGNVKITGDGFTPLSTHTTILSGKEDSEENDIIQDVKIESDISKFGELVLKKPINCYNFSPDILTISKLLSTVVKDEEAPKQVTELYLKEVGEVTLTLSWNPAYDNIGVSRYEIYRNGVKIASTMKTEYEDNGLEPGSTYEYAVIAVDFSKNRSVISERVKGTTLLDSQPPTKPANLRISRASGSVIAFEWGTSTDNTQVVGYAIYRDGQLLDEIGNELSYCDKSLGDEKIHTYKIRAFDLSGNYSEASNEVKASLKKPKIVDMLPCEGGTIGGNTTELILYYEGNSNSIGNKVRFQYSADDGVTWENINDSLLGQQGMDKGYLYSTYRWNISSLPSGPCKLRALLYDEDNSIAAKIINCTYDTEPPMTPDHVMAISNNGLVTLSWLPSVSADTEGYTIYRAEEGGTYHKVFEKDTYTDVVYEDRDVAVGKTYRYKVTAFDYYHNESAESIEVKTTVLADTEKPEVSLINTESLRICKTVNIHVEATDNIGVEEIRLEYLKGEQWIEVDGGNKKAEKGAADFEFDTRVVMDGSCIFRATATDVNGNVSKERTKTLIIDNTGISQIVLKDVTSDSDTVTLKWNTVEDEDFAYFSVEQLIDGEYTQIAKVVNTLGYQVTNLNENQTYTFRVVGYDDIGNEGIPSKKVVITTKDDVTPPEFQAYSVTNRNRFANNISINFKANDNQALDSLLIEYSTNCENWKQADIIEIPDNKKSYSGTYHLDVSNIREGNIFFRFTMTDLAGNCYLTNDKLPVLEYVIDRTSPDPVCNLKAESSCGYISLSWDEPTAKDDQYYFDIYRKEGDDGKYEKLVEDSTSLKYYDMKVQEGVRYFYKVITVDTAGNYSADSEIVSSKTEPDIEAPVIYSITPQNGSIIGKNQDIEIYVADNIEVADVMLAYKPVVSQDDYWYPISTISVNKQMKIIKTQWDISHLKEDSYKLRVIATDSSGNESKSYEVTYKLDREEPEAVVLSGKGAGYQSHLSWNSCNSTDFDHYEIYRKIEGKSYALYHELTDTVYTDTELNPGQKYSYKIYSYDKNGNYSVSNEVSTIPTDCDEIAPKAVVSEKISTKVGAETVFDGSSSTDNVGIKEYYWDFGNGDTAQGVSPKYTYYKTGSYEVTLTVTDIAGNQSTAKTSVEVREITASVLKVKVTNASGIGLHEAAVTIIQGERKEIIFTNQEGIASVALEGGIYEVYAYKEKYMPMKENCTLVTGVDKSMGFSLNEGEAVSAELTSRELSLQELRELKVDFSDPNNWYTREIEVWYYKENGEKGHVSDKTLIVGINEPIYWTNVDESYNFRLDIIETDKGPKEIYYLWITKEYLKDMFEVKLEITNNAEEDFSIIKGKAEINLPKGLSLLNVNKEQALLQKPEPISGGSSESIYWYIKGDEPGTYHISADFTGELSPIGMPISVKAETKNPIIVTNNKYTEITDDGFVGENKKEYNIYVSDSKGKPVKNAYVMLSYGGLGTASITNRQGRAKLYVDEYDKRQLKLLVRKSGYLNIVYESYTANCSLYQDFITLYKVGESIVPPETEDDKPSATPKGPQPPSSTAEPTPKPSAPDQWEFSLGVDEYNLEVPENIPFIGGSKLDLDLGYLPVSFQKEGNTFRIGLGTSNIFDNEYKWASFKNIVNKVSKSKETKEFLSSILDQGYKANSKFFPIEGEFRIYGYVEGTLKNNKITSAGGYIRFEIKAKGDKEWQTIVGPVPVVVKTKLEAGMEFTAKAGVDYGKKRIYSDSSIILTLPKITISAGIGFAKVADISVYGSAQNEMLFSTKDVFKLKGEAGISAKLLFASYKKAFIKGENVYYDSSKKNQKKIRALEKSSALYQAAENYVVERSKEKQGTDWNDQINMLTEEAVEAKEALSSVSNLAKPQIVSLKNGDKVLVYLDEVPERTTGNHTAVYYSWYHDNVWSKPKMVEDDGTADFEPHLASDGEQAYLVWMNTKHNDFTATTNILDVLSDCEISITKFNMDKKNCETAQRLTNNSYPDMNPKLFVAEGKPYVTWVSNESTNILEGKGIQKIMLAKQENEYWEVKPCVVAEDKELSSAVVGMLNQQISIAYVKDLDGDVTTVEDKEVFLYHENGEISRITRNLSEEENPVFSKIRGEDSLLWYDEKGIQYTSNVNTINTLITADEKISPDFVIANGRDKDYLLCSSAESDGRSISCYHINKDTVTKPIKITSQSGYCKNMSVVCDNDVLQVAYTCTLPEITQEDIKEPTSLWLLRVPIYHDLAVADLFYDEENLQKGKKWTISAVLDNYGFATESDYTVSIYRGDEVLFRNKYTDQIGIGESQTLDMEMTVPEDFNPNTKLTVIVTPEGKDSRDTNNIYEFNVGKTNLELSLDKNQISAMQPLQVNIKNTSAFDTEAVLQIRAVDENGEVLKEYPIGKLSANQSKELILSGEELNLYAQKADSCLYVNVVTEEEELYHADNYRYIFVELLKEDEDKKTDTSSTDTSRTSQDIMFPKEVSPQDISPTETNPQHINDKNIKRKLQKVTKIKLKKNKKKIVVSWKKQKKITGYQIMYATNKKFKKGKKRLVKKANYKFLIPKKGKYCYVKIRSYLKKGKKVQYSSWSKRKKIRIKK